ncbi:DAYSLEEPER [Hibiscus trionum]|uniref:DAYSLEEPER n=1 Tax=Hibiscus trionum TaxID=183268 RepID=A0A9W7IXK5_HIBTR|nr:DAYSLEEPER [Hibiscus trionum]
MLACSIKFKEVFSRLALEDREYVYCPSLEDWGKIEKLFEILKVFYDTTNVISGSEYPTFNLFLSEIYRIKLLLDTNSKSSDDFVKSMVTSMKERENVHKVRETLYELYDEYVNLYSPPLMEQVGECGTSANICGGGMGSTPGLLEILQAVGSEEMTENKQSEVDLYLEEGCYIPQEMKRKNKKNYEDQSKEIILPAL